MSRDGRGRQSERGKEAKDDKMGEIRQRLLKTWRQKRNVRGKPGRYKMRWRERKELLDKSM